jgi:hypothetical protein
MGMNHKWHLCGRLRNWKPSPQLFAGGARLHWLRVVLALGLVGCAPGGAPIKETQYPVRIVGDWQGKVGGMKETITFNAGGKFVSEVRPQGFISNTLSQGVTGTIRGTWAIKNKVITLIITSAQDERLLNKATSSTILTFIRNELVVKSATGETSTFVRTLTL